MSQSGTSFMLRVTHLGTLALTLLALLLPPNIEALTLVVLFLSSLHFSATWVLFYGEKGSVRRDPWLGAVFPLALLVLATFWDGWHEASWRMALLLFFPLLFWHYAKQSLGLVVYSLRGVPAFRDPQSGRRQGVLGAFLMMGVMGYLCSQTATRNTLAFGLYIPGIPLELGDWVLALRAASLAGLAYVAFECWRVRQYVAVATAAAFYLWMDLPLSGFHLLALLPGLHAIQYLPVVFRRWQGKGWTWKILLPWVIAGGITFLAIWLKPGGRIGLAALFTGMEIVVNVHHYFLDGKIWRARDESTRAEMGL